MSTAVVGVSLWLTLGLVVQAIVCGLQWRHLGRLAANDPGRAVGYGQRRALFQWLGFFEQVVRAAFWLGAGALGLLFQAVADSGLAGAVVFAAVFALVDQLLRQVMPWARWLWVDRAYGMSRMRARERLADTLRHIALQIAIAVAAGLWVLWPLVFMTASEAGYLVWPWAWLASAALLVSGAAALFWGRPHLIEPLFHRFTALAPGELRTRLEAMMARCGVELEDVWVVDSSRRSKLANAYFAGLGRRKRVVLFDTLIAGLEPAELEAVMAHELGHDRCGHLRRYYGLQGCVLAGSFLGFGLLHAFVAPATSPVVWAVAAYVLLPALAWPLQPWFAWLRRRYEFEADAYAVRHAERAALVSALERLFANNLGGLTMARGYAIFFATHPPPDARLSALSG